MSNLQQIVDRLEFLLNKEKATKQDLRHYTREFWQAHMDELGVLRTHSVMAFCMDLLDVLRGLGSLAIGEPTKPLALYDTAQDLVDAMIPGNGHLN